VDDLLASLRRVANSPALCEFEFPTSTEGTVDKTKINVQFVPEGGGPEVIKKTDGAASCGSSPGWYFDDEDTPTMIHVCPQICGNFGGGVVSIVVGCEAVTFF
jgi:hypothetical protein